MTLEKLLLLLLLLQCKHMVADFMLQSGWIVRAKGTYGHLGGIVHAGLHGILSFPILLLAPLVLGTALAIAAAEMVVHYHIDWSKDYILKRSGATPTQWLFWVLTGADQLAHQVTYIAMLALAVWIL